MYAYKQPPCSYEIYHYGIKRRSGRYPYGSRDRPFQDREKEYGTELFKNAEKRNLNKFGSDKNHNILYIDGVSGSGKSTLALFLKKPNDEVIHLDSYFERKNVNEAKKNRNKNFNSFLEENNFNISILENDKLFKENIMDYFKEVDRFVKLSEKFGEKSFKNKKRVIMEGVQVGDGTLYVDKSFYNDKPFIKLTTDSETARQRARERDLKHSESEVNFKMDNIYYLSHGGPGSGRYPWGSGDRPYQRLEGSRRRSNSISEYIKSRKSKKNEERQKKEKAEEQRRQNELEKEQQRLENDKERVLKSGTASEVMKYQGKLTNQELQSAFTRLNLESQLQRLSNNEKQSALDSLKKIQSYTNVGSSLAKDGIDLWNSFVSIYNSTPEGKKNPLTSVGKGDTKKK